MHRFDDLDEHSWEDFQPDPSQPVPTERMLEPIERHVGRPPVKRSWPRWVAAASVLILVGLAGLRFWRPAEKKQALAKTPVSVEKPTIAVRQTLINSASETKTFSLPDGSKTRLARGSSLSFDSGLAGARREIVLTGEASFTVARDKSRPFTVHAEHLSVTVLGTVFGIDDTHSGYTTVVLYSGRVVVKKEPGTRGGFADVYLEPGQELQVNRGDGSVRMSTIAGTAAAEKAPAPVPRQLMSFTRQPLTEIFNELHNAYHITISYDSVALKNIDFTGTFNSGKESLESFLTTLCELNELQLKKTDKGFSVEPKQP